MNPNTIVPLLVGFIGVLMGSAATGIPLVVHLGGKVTRLEVQVARAISDIATLQKKLERNGTIQPGV